MKQRQSFCSETSSWRYVQVAGSHYESLLPTWTSKFVTLHSNLNMKSGLSSFQFRRRLGTTCVFDFPVDHSISTHRRVRIRDLKFYAISDHQTDMTRKWTQAETAEIGNECILSLAKSLHSSFRSEFAMNSHFSSPKNLFRPSPPQMVQQLIKELKTIDQMYSSNVLLPIKKVNRINTKNYWE